MAAILNARSELNKKRAVVVGAGLVGSLEALYLAERSYKVDVFESRSDPRVTDYYSGRSINLTLSTRGREALRSVGLEEKVTNMGIPIYARTIHTSNGKLKTVPYGDSSHYTLSIDRKLLNVYLMREVDKNPNINFHFNEKYIYGDFKKGEFKFENCNGTSTHHADILFGCDGSYSKVRADIMKLTRMNFKQDYINHGYKEVQMPPSSNGEFALEKNSIHIWPRQSFLMVGLPNIDKSFTLTLFMPYDLFSLIQTAGDVIKFFQKEFSDIIPLVGEENLIRDFCENPIGSLISIKCSPYNYKGKAVILGDAAHAMVPFYGQGMNCGFEDCLILNEFFDKYPKNIEIALTEYSKARNTDAEAIVDLAMNHYKELRSDVDSTMFTVRRFIDNILHWMFPSKWIPSYTMTTFSRIPYSEVICQINYQENLLKRLFRGSILITVIGVIIGHFRFYNS